MKEIAELQTQQKNEIEALYIRLGKPLPPNLGFLHSAPPSSRRRRTSKNKLKGGKLLNPLVQQLRSGTSSTSRYTGLLSVRLFFMLVVVLLCNCFDCRKGAEFLPFFMVWLKFAYCRLFLKCASFGGLLISGLINAALFWTVPTFSASGTMLGRETIFHFTLEYSLAAFSHPLSKCSLLMFVFTSLVLYLVVYFFLQDTV